MLFPQSLIIGVINDIKATQFLTLLEFTERICINIICKIYELKTLQYIIVRSVFCVLEILVNMAIPVKEMIRKTKELVCMNLSTDFINGM